MIKIALRPGGMVGYLQPANFQVFMDKLTKEAKAVSVSQWQHVSKFSVEQLLLETSDIAIQEGILVKAANVEHLVETKLDVTDSMTVVLK